MRLNTLCIFGFSNLAFGSILPDSHTAKCQEDSKELDDIYSSLSKKSEIRNDIQEQLDVVNHLRIKLFTAIASVPPGPEARCLKSACTKITFKLLNLMLSVSEGKGYHGLVRLKLPLELLEARNVCDADDLLSLNLDTTELPDDCSRAYLSVWSLHLRKRKELHGLETRPDDSKVTLKGIDNIQWWAREFAKYLARDKSQDECKIRACSLVFPRIKEILTKYYADGDYSSSEFGSGSLETDNPPSPDLTPSGTKTLTWQLWKVANGGVCDLES